jgi:hypothetical protein
VTKDHRIGPRECLSSVAFQHGFFWETLWQHARNRELREERRSPHVLRPGDVVHVPDLRPRAESCATDQRHRFMRRGVPETFSLRFMQHDRPRAGIAYTLVIDGEERRGTTDGDGYVRARLSPVARHGKLVLQPEGAPTEEYELLFRDLDPVSAVRGQKARLRNLRFYDGPLDDTLDERASAALAAFQRAEGLEITGRADEPTCAALVERHGS